MYVRPVGSFPREHCEPSEVFWVFRLYDPKEMVYLTLSAERESELRIVARNRCRVKAEFCQTLSNIRKEGYGSELKLNLHVGAVFAIHATICVE